MARLTPYAYGKGSTPLHRLDAGWKLAGLLFLSAASFTWGLPGSLFSAAAVALCAAVARIGPTRLLSGSLPICVMSLFVMAMRSIALEIRSPFGIAAAVDFTGLREGSIFALSVLVAFAGGSVLFATTTSVQLREAVGRVEEQLLLPIARGLRRLPFRFCRRAADALEGTMLSLVIALTIGFLPRVFEVWEAAEEARKARCGKTGPLGAAAMIPLVIERLIETASETARAMEGRGALLGKDTSADD